MKNYYSIVDNQLGETRAFGFNETSLKKVRLQLIEFLLLGNFSEEGEKSIEKNSLKQLLNYYEFTLRKSVKPFKE